MKHVAVPYPDELPIAVTKAIPKRYKVARVLKQSADRLAISAFDKEAGIPVVLKVGFASLQKEFKNECSCFASISSPYVVKMTDHFETPQFFCLVTEVFDYRTLQDELLPGRSLEMDSVLKIAHCVLTAMNDMHAVGILHRDLHPQHVSYKTADRLRIFDLNLCIRGAVPGTKPAVQNPHSYGTWETMAPEEFEVGAILSPATNVYSVAAFLYRFGDGSVPC